MFTTIEYYFMFSTYKLIVINSRFEALCAKKKTMKYARCYVCSKIKRQNMPFGMQRFFLLLLNIRLYAIRLWIVFDLKVTLPFLFTTAWATQEKLLATYLNEISFVNLLFLQFNFSKSYRLFFFFGYFTNITSTDTSNHFGCTRLLRNWRNTL